MLLQHFNARDALEIRRKGPADFVSNADIESERIIQSILTESFPDYGFQLEEGGVIEGKDPDHYWIIDPLDGTTNFLHGIPHFCISIGLAQRIEQHIEIIAAAILQPTTDDCYLAFKGQGAWLNGQPIKTANKNKLDGILIGTGTAFFRDQTDRHIFDAGSIACSMRCLGAAALDLAYVASGRYDAFWHRRLKPWDMAAGILLVQEAGGAVADLSGGDNPLESGSILAANRHLQGQLSGLLL